jgi:hypothetical protein
MFISDLPIERSPGGAATYLAKRIRVLKMDEVDFKSEIPKSPIGHFAAA